MASFVDCQYPADNATRSVHDRDGARRHRIRFTACEYHTFPLLRRRRGYESAFARPVNLLLYVFAALAGAMNTVQAGANAQLRKSLDQPVLAGLAVYVTGMVGLLIVLPFVRSGHLDWSRVAQAPWWAWMGGLLSIFSTMAGVMLARKLGSAAFTAATLTFSLLCSVLLDHFGLVGFEVHRASPFRILGCVLLISGLLLVTRF